MKVSQHIFKSIRICMISLMSVAFSSCLGIYDNLDPCRQYFQFKYDYNMLYADAFSSQVSKVEVFLFDSNGLFVKSVIEEGEILKDKDYQMELQLIPGDYTAITWAGQQDSFTIPTLTPGVSKMSDLTLKLNYDDTRLCNTEIDDLWHGTPVSFHFDPSVKKVVTLPLVKDNNRVRIVMKDIDATDDNAMEASDFDIKLTASNAFYDYQNNVLPDNKITYTPYFLSGNSLENVVAELNTLRFTDELDYRLTINHKPSGQSIFGEDMPDIDLKEYLLLTKMEYSNMTEQEYLDREYDWKIIIFYRSIIGKFLAMKVVVNDWTVWTQPVDVAN